MSRIVNQHQQDNAGTITYSPSLEEVPQIPSLRMHNGQKQGIYQVKKNDTKK